MKDVLIVLLGLLAFVEAMLMSVCLTLGYNDGYRDGVKFGKLLKKEGREREGMKISEIITDKYKLRIPSAVYYDLLADVQEA